MQPTNIQTSTSRQRNNLFDMDKKLLGIKSLKNSLSSTALEKRAIKYGKKLRSQHRNLYDFLRSIGRLYFILSKNSAAAHYVRKRKGFVVVQYGSKFMVSRHVRKFSSQSAITRNLDEVSEICRKSKIEYSYVPGFSDARSRVLISNEDRKTFLDIANRHLRNKGYYLTDNIRSKKRFKLVNGHGLPKRFYNSDILFIFHLESRGSVTFADANNRCDIEFWFDEKEARRRGMPEETMLDGKKLADIHGCIIAPTNNRVATVLTPEQRKMRNITIGGKQYKAYTPFTKSYTDELEVNFPIDIVYTWVDSSDPKWRKKYQAARKQIDPAFAMSNTESRYTSRDELKYSLRGIAMYAPWVRNIYIITDDQKPTWLKEDSRLKIVSHKDIFSRKSSLPVFNSHAIESRMHHIPGLADHYVYLNDDMAFTSHVSPSMLFTESGIAKLFPSRALFGVGGQMSPESIPSIAGNHDARLLASKYGRRPTHKFAHTPLPQVKRAAKEVSEIFADSFRSTSASKFRHKTDISPITLINHYSLVKGFAIRARYKLSVIDLSKWDDDYAHWVLHHKPRAMCINDTVDLSEEQKNSIEPKLRVFLNRMFPFKSPWEK